MIPIMIRKYNMIHQQVVEEDVIQLLGCGYIVIFSKNGERSF